MADAAYTLGKLLQEGISPFNWAMLFLFASLAAFWRNKRKGAIRFQIAGLALLLVPATGFVAEAMMRPLENAYPVKPVDEYAPAELIVVLGGTTAAVRPPRIDAEEINGARLQTAVRLFRAGKAKQIIVTGGPYRHKGEVERSEAQDMRDVLEGLGVPRTAIVMEPNSRNTYENAVFTAQKLGGGVGRILLVTSALHMPRAAALFAKQGIEVEPVPCSHRSGCPHGLVSGLKPAVVHIHNSEAAIKEYVGRLAYWLGGRT
jgi:uncharacterized SAM-binding protein YcdF (DUF218 family)